MTEDVDHQIAELKRLTPTQLRDRYAELFGEPCRSSNRGWLVKRIAWRIQALAEGGLSERARLRAQELACEADLRLSPPTEPRPSPPPVGPRRRQGRDGRLPEPGTILQRRYQGKFLEVLVLKNGFRLDGTVYRTLSAVAKAVTGSHCNGFLFFGLSSRRRGS